MQTRFSPFGTIPYNLVEELCTFPSKRLDRAHPNGMEIAQMNDLHLLSSWGKINAKTSVVKVKV